MSRAIKELWDTFDRGDHLSEPELRALIKSAEQGLGYLQARGERLATCKTLMDLERLLAYQYARRTR